MEFKLLNESEYLEYLPQIHELFEACFKRSIDESYFKWRYLDKEDLLVFVAFDKGKLIANYSVFPCKINYEKKTIKAALSMTTMTHPLYNGRGIFTNLADSLYRYMKKQGYDIVFGFPNINSHSTFINKLGWKDIYEIPTMVLNNISVEYIDSEYEVILDNNFELNYNEVLKNEFTFSVKKNADYFKWRFSKNPINCYLNYVLLKDNIVLANCVIKYYNNEMDIVEVNAIENKFLEILIKNVIALNRNYINKVNTWINVNSDIHRIYEKIGFMNSTPITYFGAKGLNDSIKESIFNFKEWFIQMSDSDVF